MKIKISQAKIVTLVSLFFVVAAIVLLFFIQKLELSAATSVAKRTAEVLVSTINQARISYSNNAVSAVRHHPDIHVQADYRGIDFSIPNPATFAIELGDAISRPEDGLILRTYSQYPFHGREKTGGARDDFERESLKNITAKNPILTTVAEING